MMPSKTKLFFYRGMKNFFVKYQLHRIVEPLSGPLLDILYLSKISKWVKEHRNVEFNDFYSSTWDYQKRYGLYEYVVKREKLDGPLTYLEFGVSGGDSFRWWVSNTRTPLPRYSPVPSRASVGTAFPARRACAMSTDSQ